MIEYETSPALAALPRLRHGFFGRAGGVSQGEFAGLNVSAAVGDDEQSVARNRQSIADMLAVGPLVILKQTHSTRVHAVTAPITPASVDADAMVCAMPGLALAILTADCTPILFADAHAGVIGAAHAGWRGAADGIIEKTVAAMASLGAERSRIVAAFGPTIHAVNYEVGDTFKSDFLALHPDASGHFHTPAGARPHFDLPGFVASQLQAAGINVVDPVGACTYAHPERYFSHRYATHLGLRTGRQLSVVGIA